MCCLFLSFLPNNLSCLVFRMPLLVFLLLWFLELITVRDSRLAGHPFFIASYILFIYFLEFARGSLSVFWVPKPLPVMVEDSVLCKGLFTHLHTFLCAVSHSAAFLGTCPVLRIGSCSCGTVRYIRTAGACLDAEVGRTTVMGQTQPHKAAMVTTTIVCFVLWFVSPTFLVVVVPNNFWHFFFLNTEFAVCGSVALRTYPLLFCCHFPFC